MSDDALSVRLAAARWAYGVARLRCGPGSAGAAGGLAALAWIGSELGDDAAARAAILRRAAAGPSGRPTRGRVRLSIHRPLVRDNRERLDRIEAALARLLDGPRTAGAAGGPC